MSTTALRKLRYRLVFAAAVALGLVSLAACGSGDEPEASPEAQSDASSEPSGNEVVMRLIAYKPASLTVDTGTSVTWKQQDAGFHTVTSGTVDKDASGLVKTNPDGRFDSGQIAKDMDYSFTFSEAGTYDYFCEVHPATMTGKVTAQ